MTSLRKGDEDLHYEDGGHRGTPPTTDGRALDEYERRSRAHLAEHERRSRDYDYRVDQIQRVLDHPERDEDWFRLRIEGRGGFTKWMNISQGEVEAIRDLLAEPSEEAERAATARLLASWNRRRHDEEDG